MQVIFRPMVPVHRIPVWADDLDGVRAQRYRSLVETWQRVFGLRDDDLEEDFVDFEDWVENAVRLQAAIQDGHAIYGEGNDPRLYTSSDDPSPRPLGPDTGPFDPSAPTIVLGRTPKSDPLIGLPGEVGASQEPRYPGICWPDARSEDAAARYASNPAFPDVAGRRVEITSMPASWTEAGRDNDLDKRLAAWAADGPVDAKLKIVAHSAKYAHPMSIHIPAGADRRQVRSEILRTLEYAAIHLEGIENAILLQDDVEMGHEYRIFVVDGVPVGGAGCIEHHTPLDATAETLRDSFDVRVEPERNDGNIQARPELVFDYMNQASWAADRLIAEEPALRDMVIDLCTYSDGSIGVVEVNPIAGSGLYATPFADRVFPAVVMFSAATEKIEPRF